MQIGMGLSITGARNPEGSGTPPDPDVEAFFARLVPSVTVFYEEPYTTLIKALKTAGVWAKLDALYVMRTGNAQWAQRNLVQDAYNLVPTNSPFFTATLGYEGNTNAWLNTQFDPSAPTVANPKFIRDSATMLVRGGSTAANAAGMMGQQSGTKRNQLHGKYTDGRIYNKVNSGIQTFQVYAGNNDAFFQVSRPNSAGTELTINGVQTSTAVAASATLVTAPLSLLVADVADGYFPGFIHYAAIGGYLDQTESLALYNALAAYDSIFG